MSDVSAVLLSIGEPYTQRAIESVGAQTIPMHAVIVIENVSPFFRAINEGARRVTTTFFVQVDADMILDPACAELLLGAVRPDTGIVVGELRDAFLGQTIGVKLFRTECFRRAGMPDSITPDTDFGETLRVLGWQTHYVESTGSGLSKRRPALGEHRPDYTPAYTYRKFLLEGARLRVRAARHGLFWQMGMLEHSAHPQAVLAQVALAHGFFQHLAQDELKANVNEPKAAWLVQLLDSSGRIEGMAGSLGLAFPRPRLGELFKSYAATGRAVARAGAGTTFREIFAGLSGAGDDSHALVAKVALGHGLLSGDGDMARLAIDERAFREFMLFRIGLRSNQRDRLRGRASYLLKTAFGANPVAPW